MRYLPVSVAALGVGVAIASYSAPEGVLPAAVLLSIAWVINRERRRVDQAGLYQLYAVSVVVIMLATVGLVVVQPRRGLISFTLIAATALPLAPIIICARRDLDQRGRRKLYVISIIAAMLTTCATFLFVPAIR